MNGFNLLLTLYLIIHNIRAFKVDKRMIVVRQRDMEVFSRNSSGQLTNRLYEESAHYTNETLVPIYSKWSHWSRCENCVQNRIKKCIDQSCNDTRLLEERPCKKKRCIRQRLLKSGDMHVVKKVRGRDLTTRTLHTRQWTKWSDWSTCSIKCRTRRFRTCKKPGKCKKRRQVQFAYCYHERSKCQHYVLHLIDNNKIPNPAAYEYNNNGRAGVHDQWKKKCGRSFAKRKMLKIIGGAESEQDKWPWHVAILNKYKEAFCGGTLISPRWVLTAGHCLRNYLRVRFNEHDLTTTDGREMTITVNRMFLHPHFDHYTVDNDIALLRLPIPVNQPVACLPTSAPIARKLCYVMGWGKKNTADRYGTIKLQEARIPIVNETTCRRSYKSYVITNNMFCAGWKSGLADTCAGDSGGGLMCSKKGPNTRGSRFSIQGITSFGDGCGRKNKYGIYTRVDNYLKWIEQTIEMYS